MGADSFSTNEGTGQLNLYVPPQLGQARRDRRKSLQTRWNIVPLRRVGLSCVHAWDEVPVPCGEGGWEIRCGALPSGPPHNILITGSEILAENKPHWVPVVLAGSKILAKKQTSIGSCRWIAVRPPNPTLAMLYQMAHRLIGEALLHIGALQFTIAMLCQIGPLQLYW